uniref:Uncharacterized protein n=1 Tax=Anopheles farauti TaxID=69004 RepID=A0A182QZ27_9DIPT
MVHLYQTSVAPNQTKAPAVKTGNFMATFRGLFFRTSQTKLNSSSPGAHAGDALVGSRLSPKAPIASPESGSEPSSLVLAPHSPDQATLAQHHQQHRMVTIQLPHHGDNRYDIRKNAVTANRETGARATERRRAKSAIKAVKRRSFGKRINNLWSNFGLLRSSEKIVEFANGHGSVVWAVGPARSVMPSVVTVLLNSLDRAARETSGGARSVLITARSLLTVEPTKIKASRRGLSGAGVKKTCSTSSRPPARPFGREEIRGSPRDH